MTYWNEPAKIPITGPAPYPRPRCPGCGVPLRPEYEVQNQAGEDVFGVARADPAMDAVGVRRVWVKWKGYGHFHSQTCATRWANRIWSRSLASQGKNIPLGIRGWGVPPTRSGETTSGGGAS